MTPGARLRQLILLGLGLAVGACAAAPPAPQTAVPAPAGPSLAAPSPGRPTAPAPGTPAPPPPLSPLESLVSVHREKAQGLGREGRLRQALDEWKIVLTLDPNDPGAREGKKKLEDRIEHGVADRVQKGREALRRGDQLEARRHFLAALALDPANKVAFDALQNEVKELRFFIHTVRRGETLATIAEQYYGDRSRSEVIWETNQLPPNPRLAVGSTLRIPEIPGVPFVHPDARARVPSDTTRPEAASPDLPRPGGSREEAPEINPLLVEAKEALEKGEYAVALADVDKVLAGNAQNAEGVDLKKAILYGLGKSQLGQRRYDESYQTLTQLAKLAPNYQDSAALLRQARDRLVQQHYGQGLRLFQEEKLEEAITQWRTVLEYDPQHANAKKNIEQAERLLRNLQQRQQPKKQ